jgi:hypothetical protein
MAKEKNLGKLKSRFEVGGGLINEYNYQQNQGEITEEEKNRFAGQQEQSALRGGGAKKAAAKKGATKKAAGKKGTAKKGGRGGS